MYVQWDEKCVNTPGTEISTPPGILPRKMKLLGAGLAAWVPSEPPKSPYGTGGLSLYY